VLQEACRQHPDVMVRLEIEKIVHGLDEKKRPELLGFYMWRMVMNLGLSHQTADHVLWNLERLFNDQDMINDAPIDWHKEQDNKVSLIQRLNCGAVRSYCAFNLNDQHSICLQEFIYGRINPKTSLTLAGPYMPYELVEHSAHYAGCHNTKAFDIKHDDEFLAYHAKENHKFCCE
jgi:hypothetical protein